MEREYIGPVGRDRLVGISSGSRWGTRVLEASSDWEVVSLQRRLWAGVWSARVAFVLSVPFVIFAWVLGVEHAWLFFMLLPVVASFFSGAFFGAAICDSKRVTDGSLAGRRGVLVALGAYVILAAEVAVLSDAWLHAFFDTFMGAIVVSGWLGLPAGFLAGLMAFRVREGATKHRRPVKAEVELVAADAKADTVRVSASHVEADDSVRHPLG